MMIIKSEMMADDNQVGNDGTGDAKVARMKKRMTNLYSGCNAWKPKIASACPLKWQPYHSHAELNGQ